MMSFESSCPSAAMKAYASIPKALIRVDEGRVAIAELISICVELAMTAETTQVVRNIKDCFSLVDLNQLDIIETIEGRRSSHDDC